MLRYADSVDDIWEEKEFGLPNFPEVSEQVLEYLCEVATKLSALNHESMVGIKSIVHRT